MTIIRNEASVNKQTGLKNQEQETRKKSYLHHQQSHRTIIFLHILIKIISPN